MDRLTSVSADAREVISGVIMVRTAKPEKDMEKRRSRSQVVQQEIAYMEL